MVKATAASTNGSCADAWKTTAESTRLAATPSSNPATDPPASRTSIRPSAAERTCFACAPRATRMLSSRSRLLTVYEARPKVPVIESSNPKAPNRPRATVATWAGKKLIPSWLLHSLDVRMGTAGSRSRTILRMVAAISAVATPVGSGLVRTTSDVFVVGRCEIGKYAAALGVSLIRNILPSAMMPTIWMETPELFLK